MTTVPQSLTTVQFDAALRTLAARATERYAGEAARIDRGLCLALNGHVQLHADRTASVTSGRDAEVVYTVHGHCDCPDARRAPGGRCKHRWATCLVKRAQAQVHAQKKPSAPTYYASYYTADAAWLQGTATYLEARGWVFRSDADDFTLQYADEASLVLGGRVDLLEAQRAADGDLVRKVCGMVR